MRGLVSLGLGGRHSETQPAPVAEAVVFRRILDEALAVLNDAIEAEEVIPPDVSAAVDAFRAGIAGGLGAAGLDPLAAICFTSIRRFTSHARGSATARRAQVTALVATVRETVATIAGNQNSLHDSLAGSVERVDRIARLDNLCEIQERLVEEVAALKQIAIERRASWEQTFQDFGRRLTGLETQLDTTRREATIDPLTNVANRRMFERTCKAWMGPHRPPFVLATIDVDDFKAVNDQHGHDVGDRVLVAVAETLVRSLRTDDLVARLGGDEFAILAAPLTLQQAQGRFASFVNAVSAACRQVMPDGSAVTISIGIAELSAGDTVESVQKRADQALYEAKRAGKGRVAVKATPFIRDLVKGGRLTVCSR
jgi:diguanylate cyclase